MVVKNIEKTISGVGKREIAGRTVGGWAFVIGLILAVIIAIVGSNQSWPIYLLLILGLIVGLFNITEKETSSFLLAAIAFMLTFVSLGAIARGIPAVGNNLAEFFSLVNAFVAPAAAVVAFKALFAHVKD